MDHFAYTIKVSVDPIVLSLMTRNLILLFLEYYYCYYHFFVISYYVKVSNITTL